MKRTIIFLLLSIAIMSLSLSNMQSYSKTNNTNEIKVKIFYDPPDGWTVNAYLSTTFYGSCGATNASGTCGIEDLPSGTYTIKVTRNGCTGILNNVYHPGAGQTLADFGPTVPDLNCQ